MFDRNKFKALVHYICWKRSNDPDSLGSVKLNKILWLSDFVAYYNLGDPITGARYVKRQFGPVPHQILPVLKELESEGVLAVKSGDYYGKQKKKYVVYEEASGDFLLDSEREIVDNLIDTICDDHTAASISKASHDHIWKAAEDGEEIPYFTIFARPGEIGAEEREWASLQLEGSPL